MENSNFDFWMFIAGLGIFLFGMRHLEDSIKQLAGKSFKTLLHRFTNRSWKGILTGTAITAILQSSSMVSLLALAFLGGGIIGLKNAVGIVLGANLGTTFTAWIVATFGFKMDIADFSFPFLAVGILSYLFLNSRPYLKNIGGVLVGFGLLFLGLDYMKIAIENVADQIDLVTFASYGLWTFLLLGIIITSLIQSSSAMIVIILSALNADLIDIYQAVSMVIGANIGTTTTLVFLSIGGTADKKRLMLANVIFKVVAGLVLFVFIRQMVYVTYAVFGVTDPLMELVLLNTLLNLTGILMFYPFLGLFEKFLNKRFVSATPLGETLYVKNIAPNVTYVALNALDRELEQVYYLTRDFVQENFGLGESRHRHKSGWKTLFSTASGLIKKYEKIKRLEDELTSYYSLVQEETLTPQEAEQLTAIMMGLRSLIYGSKDIKDVMHNILQMKESGDPVAQDVLKRLRKLVKQRLAEIDETLESGDDTSLKYSWLQENENFYNEIIIHLYKHLREQNKNGVPVSTMTNVIKQSVSSMDNLCSAVLYWKFKKVATLEKGENVEVN